MIKKYHIHFTDTHNKQKISSINTCKSCHILRNQNNNKKLPKLLFLLSFLGTLFSTGLCKYDSTAAIVLFHPSILFLNTLTFNLEKGKRLDIRLNQQGSNEGLKILAAAVFYYL